VRHNGGSVWFDELGWPWPKHGCFFDDVTGIRLRTELRKQPEEGGTKILGIVIEIVVVDPGKSARFVVNCSDKCVIDDVFSISPGLGLYPGSLVVVEKTDGNTRLTRIAIEETKIEVWRSPHLGLILVYDPRRQDGDDRSSTFWVWKDDRWTTLRDFNIQPLLLHLDDDEMMMQVMWEYLNRYSVPPSPPVRRVSRIFGGWLRKPIEVKIFPGTPNERSFKLPGTFTADRVAEWIRVVEAIRAPRRNNAGSS
jgi:hypothetical protein